MMRRFYTLITVSFFIALSSTSYCQNKSLFENRIKGRVIDTLEINENDMVVHIKWLDDTLRVKIQNQKLHFDFEKMIKASRGKSSLETEKGRQLFVQDMKTWGQNCFSYALERYFANNGFCSQRVFNKRTTIGLETIHQVIANYFEEVIAFSTTPKRNLKTKLPDNVLLAFLNSSDLIIHAVYYSNGIFYTKNGGFKASEFVNLKKFLKENYWDTKTIKVFKLNKAKVNFQKIGNSICGNSES
ncbi:MAG: hypothetical protein ACEPOZ_02595 [Marinifilaceae bacterium]